MVGLLFHATWGDDDTTFLGRDDGEESGDGKKDDRDQPKQDAVGHFLGIFAPALLVFDDGVVVKCSKEAVADQYNC